MPEQANPLTVALLILLVILIFNLIIFVHELGHFWAAKWRGLKIDRFQIWFGKPLWKKEINGVQYGLGWIPAGGFVALPQMAPMEAIEGNNRDSEPQLAPVSPLDKIIVAFAGPLFSFLLAFVSACLITFLGKPLETVPTTTIGWVQPGSPGEEAGLQRGDIIKRINDEPIEMWAGSMDSVFMNIVTSRGDKIKFTIDRPEAGEMEVVSSFVTPETKWWQRRATRQVGIEPLSGPVEIVRLPVENAPASLAGLQVGDQVLAINQTKILTDSQALVLLEKNGAAPFELTFVRGDGEPQTVTITPVRPVSPASLSERFMIGATFGSQGELSETWVHPGPFEQMGETVRQMWVTIRTIAAPDSGLGIQHLSGPVGIGKLQYFTLQMDHPFHRILGFMVLININLAILNLLPFPVLDGGHITIAMMEAIAGHPVRARFLEVLQLGFMFILFGIMLYVTSKDIPDNFGMGRSSSASEPIVFPAPQ